MQTATGWVELRTLLALNGMTQAELAAATDLSPAYISALVRGYRRPTSKVINRCSVALRIPKSMLLPLTVQAA